MSSINSPHEGRVALVTGAAGGIGRAYALRLAAGGAAVIVADISDPAETVTLIEAAGGRAIGALCDVSSEESVAALAATAAEFGGVDILVNNAGIYPFKAIADLSFEEWRRVMSVNLDSVFLMTAAFLPRMREEGWGRIINIATGMFHQGTPGAAHYVASKGGVIGITRSVASEVGVDGVTVNAVAPGLTRSPGTSKGYHDSAGLFDKVAQAQSIKRTQQPDDLDGVVDFLASDDARFITGQTLVVDGGLVKA